MNSDPDPGDWTKSRSDPLNKNQVKIGFEYQIFPTLDPTHIPGSATLPRVVMILACCICEPLCQPKRCVRLYVGECNLIIGKTSWTYSIYKGRAFGGVEISSCTARD